MESDETWKNFFAQIGLIVNKYTYKLDWSGRIKGTQTMTVHAQDQEEAYHLVSNIELREPFDPVSDYEIEINDQDLYCIEEAE